MNLSTSTELKDEQLLIVNEIDHKLKELDSFYQSQVESAATNVHQLKFVDFSVAKIINSTIKEMSLNGNSEIIPLVHEKINSIICNFTQSYPDIPKKQMSDLCNEDIESNKTTTNISPHSVEKPSINNNSKERCFNFIENPIVIPSDDSENAIINYTFEYNPAFKETIVDNELKTKSKNIKIKLKTGVEDFHFVLNVGFGHSPKGIILKCFTGYCIFKSYDRDIFKSHFENFHNTTKFKGTCGVCEQILVISNLSDEIDHIYKCHMKMTPEQKKEATVNENNVPLTDVSDDQIVPYSKQIDELIKLLEDEDDIPIVSDFAVEGKYSINPIVISSSNLIAMQILPEIPMEVDTLLPLSDGKDSDSSNVSVTHCTNLVETIPQKRKKHSKSSSIQSSKNSSNRLINTTDLESVNKKNDETDKDLSEKLTATSEKLSLRVSLEKLSDKTIAQYLNRSKFKSPNTVAHKKSDHKESSKSNQDKSMQNKDLKQISHKSVQIVKKTIPTEFKRSLSLKQLKIILKKCNNNKNETDSNSYKVLNQTNDSMDLHSCEENPENKIITESIVSSGLSKETEQMTKSLNPNKKETAPSKLFDDVLLLLDEPLKKSFKSKKSSNLCLVDKTPSHDNSTPKTVDPKNKNDNKVATISKSNLEELPVNKLDKTTTNNNEERSSTVNDSALEVPPINKLPCKNITLKCNNKVVSSRSADINLGETSTRKLTEITKNNNEERSATVEDSVLEVISANKVTDKNNTEVPSRVTKTNLGEQSISNFNTNTETPGTYGKFNVKEIILKSPIIRNENQFSIDKASILAELSACTFLKQLNTSQKLNNCSKPEPENLNKIISPSTSDHVPKVKHVNFSLLQPWLINRRHCKYDISCCKQLQKNSLLARFKCMGFTCSFYTCDKKLYKLHLKQHQYHVKIDAHDTFLFCSYCLYNTKNIDELIDHICIAHQFDRYQCPYCFYRSCEVQSCATHVTTHHLFQTRFIMECPIENVPIDVDKLIDKIQLNRLKYVAPFRCNVCSKCFFLGEAYVVHIKTHVDKQNEQIVRNGLLLLQKLMDDQHYGLHQCLYCVYGTKSEDEIRVHLSNCHPSEYTYYCKRESLPKSNTSAEFMESTQIIKLGKQNVNIEKLTSSVEDLINKENWWKLSDKKPVRKMSSSASEASM